MRGAACRDKKNTGVKNPWKELPRERKGGRNLLRSHDAFVRSFVSVSERIHRDPNGGSFVSIPCAPGSRDQIKRVVFFVHQDSVHQVLLGYSGGKRISLKPASSDQQIASPFLSPKNREAESNTGYGTILLHPRRRSRRRAERFETLGKRPDSREIVLSIRINTYLN